MVGIGWAYGGQGSMGVQCAWVTGEGIDTDGCVFGGYGGHSCFIPQKKLPNDLRSPFSVRNKQDNSPFLVFILIGSDGRIHRIGLLREEIVDIA